MVQYTIETITILTVAVIGVILAVYLLILKRNGWLGRGGKFYRCPNRECQKIFQKPIELKDLSETPARVYPACPNCGADLRSFFGSRGKKGLSLAAENAIQGKKPETKIGYGVSKLEAKKPEIDDGSRTKPLKSVEVVKPQIATGNRWKPWASETSGSASGSEDDDLDALLKIPQKSHPQPKEQEEPRKATSDSNIEPSKYRPEGCSHFFGYLRSLPKGTKVSNECYSCPKMVDCYLQKE